MCVYDLAWPQVVYDTPESFNVADNKGDACISGCTLTVNTDAICKSPNGVESEDCLFLSIWRRQQDRIPRLVVILHGGGFLAGSGMADFTDAEEVARQTGPSVGWSSVMWHSATVHSTDSSRGCVTDARRYSSTRSFRCVGG